MAPRDKHKGDTYMKVHDAPNLNLASDELL